MSDVVPIPPPPPPPSGGGGVSGTRSLGLSESTGRAEIVPPGTWRLWPDPDPEPVYVNVEGNNHEVEAFIAAYDPERRSRTVVLHGASVRVEPARPRTVLLPDLSTGEVTEIPATPPPRRSVQACEAGYEVSGSDFVTTCEVLAAAVAAELDRVDPLPYPEEDR